MQTETTILPERIKLAVMARFNPLRNITPETLVGQLDRWRLGYLRDFGITAETLMDRDDTTRGVASKRFKSAGRHGWEIAKREDSPEAERHAQVLGEFWDSITATNTMEQDEVGGARLLFRQMMTSVGLRYAVHEIVWQPGSKSLSAEFRHVPTWFFESTTGKLRYLQGIYDAGGVDMEPGDWLVTIGDGLMIPTSVAWMFKRLPLNDWLIYSEKFGMPKVAGKTDGAPGSAQWDAMVEAVKAFMADAACVMNRSEDISLIAAGGGGDMPYPDLVERAERAIISLWRGGDLGTMSKGGDAVGASTQSAETEILEEDDRELISETLNRQIEPQVIQWQFGQGVRPLAYIRLRGQNAKTTQLDLAVDTFLVQSGMPISITDAAERYNRRVAAEGEATLQPSTAVPASTPIANSADDPRQAVARAAALDMAPIRARLSRILLIQDPALLKEKLSSFKLQLEQMKRDMEADPEVAQALEQIMNQAVFNGMSSRAQS